MGKMKKYIAELAELTELTEKWRKKANKIFGINIPLNKISVKSIKNNGKVIFGRSIINTNGCHIIYNPNIYMADKKSFEFTIAHEIAHCVNYQIVKNSMFNKKILKQFETHPHGKQFTDILKKMGIKNENRKNYEFDMQVKMLLRKMFPS